MDLKSVRTMLEEWGSYMRQRPDLPTHLGYPSASVGAEAMAQPQQRREDEQARVDHLSAAAKRRPVRVVEVSEGGRKRQRREVVQHMIPQSQPRTSRCARPEPDFEPWPDQVQHTHQAVMMLPREEQQVVHVAYWLCCGRRSGAKRLEVGEMAYRELLARAEGAVRSYLQSRAA